MNKRIDKKYKGSLKNPIKIPPPNKPPSNKKKALLGIQSNEQSSQALTTFTESRSEYALEQTLKKLSLLLEHYKIDKKAENPWLFLALKLAKKHVPGFKIETENKGGRKLQWCDGKLLKLYAEVEEMLLNNEKKHGFNIGSACRNLIKRPEWGSYSEKTLRTKYSQAKQHPIIRAIKHINEGRAIEENLRTTPADEIKILKRAITFLETI